MDLPSSRSHTCILVVVDRFSKACKLIPLKGLPTTFKTAELITSFKTLDYSKTLYQTGAHSSYPGSGKPSFNSSVFLSVYHPNIMSKLMARLSVIFRRLGGTSNPTAIATSTAGAVSCPGPSMHKTLFGKVPLAWPLSNSASNCPCFPGQMSPRMFQLWIIGSRRARGSGTQHVHLQQAVPAFHQGHSSPAA